MCVCGGDRTKHKAWDLDFINWGGGGHKGTKGDTGLVAYEEGRGVGQMRLAFGLGLRPLRKPQ